MLSAGMPELRCEEDIDFLRIKLAFELSDKAAASQFKREINNSLNDYFRKFDNLIHNIKHG